MAIPNMQLIKTITVGAGGAANINFTGIPQTGFQDLVVVLQSRGTTTGAQWESVYIRPNGSSTDGTSRYLYGQGGTTASAAPAVIQAWGASALCTANTFGSSTIYIPNYTNALYKTMSIESISENAGTNAIQILTSGLWANNSAITSLNLVSESTFQEGSMASLYGINTDWAKGTAKATGGTISYGIDGKVYHTFTASGTFTPTTALTADVLVIAGGGPGGGYNGAGGGAGGVVYAASQSLSTARTVTIGAGGAAIYLNQGPNGNDTTFQGLTTAVGGGAAAADNNYNGISGGSGGGATYGNTPGNGTAGQGNAGSRNDGNGSGGGGGAGGGGGTNSAGGIGVGTYASWADATGTGSGGYYAGGGGGAPSNSNSTRPGGAGGGGQGGANTASTSGMANTGSGGGGKNSFGTPGSGGSGIVIVRYQG